MTESPSSGRLQPKPRLLEQPPSIDPEEGRSILRALFAQWRVKLMELVKASIAECDDLFESQSHIPDGEVEIFKKKRAE